MRHTTKILVGLTSAAVIVSGTAVAGAQALAADPTPTPSAGATLDEQAQEHVAFIREEERLARDLYTALDAHHDGLAPFSMIKNAEQRHFDAAGRLIDIYHLDDPSEGAEAGEYAFDELQERYDGWLERGLKSEQEAFTVGVELETADIADLEKMIADIDNAQVDRVLGHLLQGSEHHLGAFTKAVNGELPAGAGMRQGPNGQNGPGMRGPGLRGPGMRGPGMGGTGQEQGRQGVPGQGGQLGPRGLQQGHHGMQQRERAHMHDPHQECLLGTDGQPMQQQRGRSS